MTPVEIPCKSGRSYFIDTISGNEFILFFDNGWMALVVVTDHDHRHGIALFEAITVDIEAMRRILGEMLENVKSRGEELILKPDSTKYDGTGVEVGQQFGYMTGGFATRGRRVNLHDMNVTVEPARICVDSDCNVTICCMLNYQRGDEYDSRNIRLGSGKGFDEAFSNAMKRISGMIDDMQDVEEELYERICVSEEWGLEDDDECKG